MKYAQGLACIAGIFQVVNALPSMAPAEADRRQSTCTSPRLRKSWDAATAAEKKAYIDAAVCLTKKPSRLGMAGSKLHDDFALVHYNLANETHSVAAFLPWHRFFVHVYEEALRTECGYTGTALYWDWVADSPAPAQASVWDPITGFGGNGSSPDGSWYSYCVPDGPFKDWHPRWYSGEDIPHCLQRQWVEAEPLANQQEMLGFAYDANVIAGLFVNDEFQNFASWLEGGPHSAVHFGVGKGLGDLAPQTSPNDPIFFLHHTMVDRIWWQWQQEDPSRILAFTGESWPNETLDDIMRMGGLAPDRIVRDFMDVNSAELCYRYETLEHGAQSLARPNIS